MQINYYYFNDRVSSCFIRENCCGKTCLLNYLFKRKNPHSAQTTIGVEIVPYKINIKKQDCLFKIVDANGHWDPRWEYSNLLLLKKTIRPRLVIILYELRSDNGEEDIEHYINLVQSRYQDVDIAIIGTKLEQGILHKNQENIEKRFQNYKIYKVSINIEEIFMEIFTNFYNKYESELPHFYQLQVEEMKTREKKRKRKMRKRKNSMDVIGFVVVHLIDVIFILYYLQINKSLHQLVFQGLLYNLFKFEYTFKIL